MITLVILVCLGQPDVTAESAKIVKDMVRAAAAQRALGRKLDDTQLAALLVQAAARSASARPEKIRSRAFLVALGVGLDRSTLMRTHPTWKAVETDAERKDRLAVLGTPTLYERHDLLQHFVVSAALTATRGARSAEALGIAKELLDAQPGGSGLSFADLAADFAGIAFAELLLNQPARLTDLERDGHLSRFALSPRGLAEGLTTEQFEMRYGGVKDERFTRACQRLKDQVRDRPGYRKEPADKAKE